ncbi:MAG: T9SS type A sorting domain-containing protein [Bacteroidales bacterium]|nr:T9SS type A sorting domain-containing protein [Bacteroidales bacterium]
MSWLINYLNGGMPVLMDSIVFDQDTIVIPEGGIFAPGYMVYPIKTTDNKVIWSVSENSGVNILNNKYCLVSNAGKATVYLSSVDGTIKDSLFVDVQNQEYNEEDWHEDFDNLSDGTINRTTGFPWYTTQSHMGSFSVVNGKFTANNTNSELAWISSKVNTGGTANISLEIQGKGGLDPTDYIKVYYIADNKEPNLIIKKTINFNDDKPLLVESKNIHADQIQLFILASNSSLSEFYYWDNISITSVLSSVENTQFQYNFFYPNPIEDEFWIYQPEKHLPFNIKIINSNGSEVFQSTQDVLVMNHKLEHYLTPGVYFIILCGESFFESEKIVIH